MVEHSIPKNENLNWWLNSLFILYAVVSPISFGLPPLLQTHS